MTTFTKSDEFEGGCTCAAVRYKVVGKPLIVHCCHCTWCQRETGSAFAHNALIEAERVVVLQGETETIQIPTKSGLGQKVTRCPECKVAVWGTYVGATDAVRFVRVGTLDQPNRLPPDIHIYTSTKQDWVSIPASTLSFSEYYNSAEYWPKESLERRAALVVAYNLGKSAQ